MTKFIKIIDNRLWHIGTMMINTCKIIIILFIVFNSSLFAQSSDSADTNKNIIEELPRRNNISLEFSTSILFSASLKYERYFYNRLVNNEIDRGGINISAVYGLFIKGVTSQYLWYSGNLHSMGQRGFGVFVGTLKNVMGGSGIDPGLVAFPYYSYMYREEAKDAKDNTYQIGFQMFFVMPAFGLSFGYNF